MKHIVVAVGLLLAPLFSPANAETGAAGLSEPEKYREPDVAGPVYGRDTAYFIHADSALAARDEALLKLQVPVANLLTLERRTSEKGRAEVQADTVSAGPDTPPDFDRIRRAMFKVAIEDAIKAPHRCLMPIFKAPGDEQDLLVPLIINRVVELFFALDTGFSGDLLIPQGLLKRLRADGHLSKADVAGPPATNTLGDGSEITLQTVVIREVIMEGCRAFTNVLAVIAPAGSTPLLGRGLLSGFQQVGIEPGAGGEGGSLSLVPYGLPDDQQ